MLHPRAKAIHEVWRTQLAAKEQTTQPVFSKRLVTVSSLCIANKPIASRDGN